MDTKGIPLVELAESACRWPVSEDEMVRDHLFCGAKRYTPPGSEHTMPYCLDHCEIAYYNFRR